MNVNTTDNRLTLAKLFDLAQDFWKFSLPHLSWLLSAIFNSRSTDPPTIPCPRSPLRPELSSFSDFISIYQGGRPERGVQDGRRQSQLQVSFGKKLRISATALSRTTP